jgi:ADP-ribose pyrophosphatase YjhB (NUDIX family)
MTQPREVSAFLLGRAAKILYGSWSVGALVVVIRTDGRVLVVRNTYRRGWTLPGGFARRGERPERAASRELREEVGLDLAVQHATTICDPQRRIVDVVFQANAPQACDARRSSWEIRQTAWISPLDAMTLRSEAAAALAALRIRAAGADIPHRAA